MLIQLRKSGGSVCPKCGSTELLYAPALNQHFESSLLDFFKQEISWWHPLRRRRFAHFVREVERVTEELRSLSRYQVI